MSRPASPPASRARPRRCPPPAPSWRTPRSRTPRASGPATPRPGSRGRRRRAGGACLPAPGGRRSRRPAERRRRATRGSCSTPSGPALRSAPASRPTRAGRRSNAPRPSPRRRRAAPAAGGSRSPRRCADEPRARCAGPRGTPAPPSCSRSPRPPFLPDGARRPLHGYARLGAAQTRSQARRWPGLRTLPEEASGASRRPRRARPEEAPRIRRPPATGGKAPSPAPAATFRSAALRRTSHHASP